jgi:hypothetical protein
MTTIVTRAGKGSPLTNNEVDTNFTNLNTAKVEGPGASVDGEIALYDSTSGALLKRASITGLVKASGGVASAATAGTDYVAPGGALGTPSSGTLTNTTGLPIVAGTTGTLSVARGGTGLTALGTAGQVLTVNAGATALEYASASGGITTGKSIAMAMIFGF